jgi:ABC-type amino acid transport substrate-binding protein
MKRQLENPFILPTLLKARVSGSSLAESSTSKRLRKEKTTRIFAPCCRFGNHRMLRILVSAGWLALGACERRQTTVPPEPTSEASEASRSLLPNEYSTTAESGNRTLVLPESFGKRTGDLDEMVKARAIRALVIIDPIGFFYLSGRPHGIQYESLQEFETFANQKLKTGKLPVRVVFLPMRPDQLEAALTQGLGDFIAHPVVITPEREQRVAFSVPIQKDVSQVVVTGSALANITSFDSLAGERIYVNPLTTYYESLKRVSDLRLKTGKPPWISGPPTSIYLTTISSRW